MKGDEPRANTPYLSAHLNERSPGKLGAGVFHDVVDSPCNAAQVSILDIWVDVKYGLNIVVTEQVWKDEGDVVTNKYHYVVVEVDSEKTKVTPYEISEKKSWLPVNLINLVACHEKSLPFILVFPC